MNDLAADKYVATGKSTCAGVWITNKANHTIADGCLLGLKVVTDRLEYHVHLIIKSHNTERLFACLFLVYAYAVAHSQHNQLNIYC